VVTRLRKASAWQAHRCYGLVFSRKQDD